MNSCSLFKSAYGMPGNLGHPAQYPVTEAPEADQGVILSVCHFLATGPRLICVEVGIFCTN